jgi:DNA polymerase-3 subunit delta'
MSCWENLIGQEAVKDYLQGICRTDRKAQGYLFEGPVGVGKRTGAFTYAQVLLCHQPPEPGMACGTCKSCRWIQNRQGNLCAHPDLLLPVKFDTQGRMTEKLVGDQEPGIPLPSIQQIGEQLFRAPVNGPRRVAILPEAQRLCRGQAESANSFLKTLEEPPPNAVIVMTSSKPEALLDTIVSRVQAVRFRRLKHVEIEQGLRLQRSDLSAEALTLPVALADGSLGRALELCGGDLGDWRQQINQALSRFDAQASPGFGLGLWELAEAEGKRLYEAGQEAAAEKDEDEEEEGTEESEAEQKTAAGWNRFVFQRLLELLEVTFRDALVYHASQEPKLLLQPDALTLTQRLSEQFGERGCERVFAALKECFLASRLYVNGAVIGRFLAGKMVEALQ